ncbi:cupin domain-containing protein [Microbacterium saperdae]
MNRLELSLKHGWHFGKRPELYEYDEIARPEFGFARLWSGGMQTTLASREGITHVAAIVEGSADLTVDGESVRIEAGEIIFIDGESALDAHSPDPWARYGWFFNDSLLRGREYRPLMGQPRAIPRHSLLAMTSVANSVLGDTTTGASPSVHTRIAMEHLAAAAIFDHSTPARADPVHRDALFLAAQTVISEQYRDPALSVEVLCKVLSVSSSSLHRAYTPMGVTPRREIERLRVADALRRLALIDRRNRRAVSEVASECGFRSTARMRESLKRAGHR